MPARPTASPDAFLPITPAQVRARGWERPDVLLVSGDAYVDHPSFAAAILGRVLEAHGFRVAILPQPDWRSADAWRAFPAPRLFCGVSAGNMDSMINHYTASRKRRNADAYSPGGEIGLRPDRATNVYAQRCREAFRGVPVVLGGVEASLRRIAHYDYWSDRVWPSILLTSKADLLVYGMGEAAIVEIAQRLDAGEKVAALRDMRSVAYLLGRRETLPEHRWDDASNPDETVELPPFEQVREEKRAFAIATRLFQRDTNPLNARRLTQRHGDRTLVINPPGLPLDEAAMDALYELPYTREAHPSHGAEVPAYQTIRDSVQVMRGCFGGCTFCSITMHQGRTIQSRSPDSVVREVEALAQRPGFKGTVSDLGGPTANMYRMRCTRPEVEAVCRRPSCIHPTVCKLLGTDHAPTLEIMRRSREVPGIKRVNVASGIRMDLARQAPEYVDELVRHHVGGHLKVAPEHTSDRVLRRMRKPAQRTYEEFGERFREASQRAGRDQYLVPYFIASHPGSTLDDMIELALYLERSGQRPRQVQDFIPAPMDVATCMYWTGLDPQTLRPVEVARGARERQLQRALLQYWKPENWFLVRRALRLAGRGDLIGRGPDCLIPADPPLAALEARRAADGEPRRGAKGEARRGSGAARGGYRRPSRERGR